MGLSTCDPDISPSLAAGKAWNSVRAGRWQLWAVTYWCPRFRHVQGLTSPWTSHSIPHPACLSHYHVHDACLLTTEQLTLQGESFSTTTSLTILSWDANPLCLMLSKWWLCYSSHDRLSSESWWSSHWIGYVIESSNKKMTVSLVLNNRNSSQTSLS